MTKIIYMGTPEFAVAPLKALLKEGYDVVGVVTVPDRQKGRGLHVEASDVKKFVLEYNASHPDSAPIPILQPEKLRDASFLSSLQSLGADLFIVVAFRMLPECVWQMPPLGTFNLHASLLPKFRGAAPINWAIINGEKETGVTTFFIDSKIDTGRILLQKKCEISPRESIGTLHDKLMEMGSSLVVETVKGIESGALVPEEQGTLVASSAPKLNEENRTINWKDTADQVDRLVRGLSPYPAALTALVKGEERIPFKIFGTELCEPQAAAEPGAVRTTKEGRLFVSCSDNYLEITQLQMSGKKRMAASDFLRGFRGIEDYHFG